MTGGRSERDLVALDRATATRFAAWSLVVVGAALFGLHLAGAVPLVVGLAALVRPRISASSWAVARVLLLAVAVLLAAFSLLDQLSPLVRARGLGPDASIFVGAWSLAFLASALGALALSYAARLPRRAVPAQAHLVDGPAPEPISPELGAEVLVDRLAVGAPDTLHELRRALASLGESAWPALLAARGQASPWLRDEIDRLLPVDLREQDENA
ncbi:MAG: hypothetical protein R3F05_06990 [Planctomycetota bacterium]